MVDMVRQINRSLSMKISIVDVTLALQAEHDVSSDFMEHVEPVESLT